MSEIVSYRRGVFERSAICEESSPMPLTRFEITSRVPYAGNRRFGAVGAYEQVDGTAHFAVDPIHPANARICDLKLAPLNGAGLVEFATDFFRLAAG